MNRRLRQRRLIATVLAFVISIFVLMLLAAGTSVTLGSVEVVLMFVVAAIVAFVVYRRKSNVPRD